MAQDPRATSEIVGIAAWSVHIPQFDSTLFIGGPASKPACDAEHAYEILGRKGLLGKEAATRLALCAVHGALSVERASKASVELGLNTAVVASSNFGNLATVSSIARVLQNGTVRDISPMDAPNASSNIVSSTVAIWFGFGGPNLMVCSGATSGLDAVELGCSLLRSCRAQRVVVVGVEPDDAVAREFQAMRARSVTGERRSLRAAAAAVILHRGAPPDSPTLDYVTPIASLRAEVDNLSQCVVGPRFLARPGRKVMDVETIVGDTFGAQGVIQLAVASELVARASGAAPSFVDVLTGDSVDGWRIARVSKNRRRD